MTIRDPIHGAIDLRDSSHDGPGSLMDAVATPMVKRLRQIKQNAFASYAFLGADHTRYAHALGTMQTVRKLLDHLGGTEGHCLTEAGKQVVEQFPSAFEEQPPNGHMGKLFRHMVFAGLLQDVGELPYQFVTKEFFRLKREESDNVSARVGFDLGLVREKDALTLAAVFAAENHEAVVSLDEQLLAYLVAGPTMSNRQDPRLLALAPFLHMLEGAVDGDRLDYVFRDAYHTIGINGSPDTVISTVIDYDANGPILSDPGPVTAFFMLRASLWQQVYFHPRVRFRIVLLFEVIKAIFEQKAHDKSNKGAYRIMAEHNLTFHLTPQEFTGFTDQRLWEIFTSINGNSKARNSLSPRAQRALALLLEEYDSYESLWLPYPRAFADAGVDITVPTNLFWDAYGTLMEHRLYTAGSIRIVGPEWTLLGDAGVALEDCGGPFSEAFKAGGHSQRPPGAIQVFRPPTKERSGAAWDSINRAWTSGGVYRALKDLADANRVGALSDTWESGRFNGPKLCISFTAADLGHVERIVRILHERKFRYKLLRSNDGLGTSTEDNSRALVKESDAALIILSTAYVSAYENKAGNVYAEVEEMIYKFRATGQAYQVQFFALDPWSDLKTALPYKALVGRLDPFLGEPMRTARSLSDIEERIVSLWRNLVTHSGDGEGLRP